MFVLDTDPKQHEEGFMRALKTVLIAGTALGLAACATMADDESMMEEASMDEPMAMDIVDTAIAADDFNTLVAAVQAAGLVETLRSEGPFTVFAPTDAAFEALPDGTLDSLLLPENQDQLVTILTYHVVPGAVMAADLAGQQLEVATVQGEAVAIDGTDGVMVNQANVIQADIDASNGVIHVIDAVILPPSLTTDDH
jgi:uncharacterized surface protein with fasciclin (FAS1) repeats